MVDVDATRGKKAAILMPHARENMSETMQRYAESWAKLGLVVFAADVFGFGHGVLRALG